MWELMLSPLILLHWCTIEVYPHYHWPSEGYIPHIIPRLVLPSNAPNIGVVSFFLGVIRTPKIVLIVVQWDVDRLELATLVLTVGVTLLVDGWLWGRQTVLGKRRFDRGVVRVNIVHSRTNLWWIRFDEIRWCQHLVYVSSRLRSCSIKIVSLVALVVVVTVGFDSGTASSWSWGRTGLHHCVTFHHGTPNDIVGAPLVRVHAVQMIIGHHLQLLQPVVEELIIAIVHF